MRCRLLSSLFLLLMLCSTGCKGASDGPRAEITAPDGLTDSVVVPPELLEELQAGRLRLRGGAQPEWDTVRALSLEGRRGQMYAGFDVGVNWARNSFVLWIDADEAAALQLAQAIGARIGFSASLPPQPGLASLPESQGTYVLLTHPFGHLKGPLLWLADWVLLNYGEQVLLITPDPWLQGHHSEGFGGTF
jgi:hypothetical protein